MDKWIVQAFRLLESENDEKMSDVADSTTAVAMD